MQKKKICKKCHHIYEADEKNCPACKQQGFANSAKGRVYAFDVKNSTVAQKMGIEVKGEYAIKV